MRERTGKKKSRLETWLRSATTPVFLVATSRRVLFFNAGCEQLTGWSADEVIGEVVEFCAEADPHCLRALTAALCPPPEVLAGRELDVPVYLPNKSGPPTPRLIRFIPIREAKERLSSVLGIILPLPSPPAAQPTPPAMKYHAELSALRWSLRQRYGLKSVIANSPAMRRVLEQMVVARSCSVPIHFYGARGVGKEHLARAIHYEGDSQPGAFVPLDCRQSPHLLQLALHRLWHPEKEDASVGALRPRTLYLSDVEHLPRDLQVRLLDEHRTDDKTPRRMPLPRLMSASTLHLQDAVSDERLLPEFFYLLTTLTIDVPPLRERGDDLIPLAQAFLEARNRGASRQIGGFAEAVWAQFHEYGWPGNLDELAAVVEEAREKCTGPLIGLDDLPLRLRAGLDSQSIGPAARLLDDSPLPPLEEHLAAVERDLIRRALAKAKRNKTLAAKLLGIPRPVLYRRLEVLGIDDEGP